MAALIFLAAYALIFFGFLLVVLFLGKIRYSRAITTLCVYVACATIAFILPLFYDQIYGDLNSAQFVLVMSGIPSLAGWIGALAWLFWRKRVDLQKHCKELYFDHFPPKKTSVKHLVHLDSSRSFIGV